MGVFTLFIPCLYKATFVTFKSIQVVKNELKNEFQNCKHAYVLKESLSHLLPKR